MALVTLVPESLVTELAGRSFQCMCPLWDHSLRSLHPPGKGSGCTLLEAQAQ